MNIYIQLLSLFLLAINLPLMAQEKLPLPYSDTIKFTSLLGKRTVINVFGAYRNVQDEAMAQQLFSGVGVGFGNTSTKVTRQQFRHYENHFAYHRIAPVSDRPTRDIWANFSYQSLWQLRSFSQLTAVGVQGDVLAQVRISNGLGNSFLHWDVAGTFGIGMHLQRGKRDKMNYYFNGYIPLVGYVNRPKYGILLAASQPQDHGIGMIGRLFRVVPKFGLRFPFKSGNQWGIFYRYDYFRWRDHRDFIVRTATHQIGMSIQFKKKNSQ